MGRENKTIFVILGLLNHEPMSGYEIKKRVDLSLKMFWDTGFGQIYPTIKTLCSDGFIETFDKSTHLGPEKIQYAITEKGRSHLKEWLKIPAEPVNHKIELLLKLFFSAASSPEYPITNIEKFRGEASKNLELLNLFSESLKPIIDDSDDHLYYYLTVLFGQKLYEAYTEWSNEAIELIHNHQDPKNKN
ncbi:PadR family transcriptional regulator [Fusibacter bizertensis]